MNTIYSIALMLAFAAFTAHAEPVAAPGKPSPPAQSAPTSAKPAQPAQSASKPVQTVQTAAAPTRQMSQQDRMRECNKQATGKKGEERREFMKTCLSRKA